MFLTVPKPTVERRRGSAIVMPNKEAAKERAPMRRCVSAHISTQVPLSQRSAAKQGEPAKKNDVSAQLNLAMIFEVKKDFDAAFKIYQKASQTGSEIAEISLGRYYANGLGVKKSHTKAAQCFKSTADSGNPLGMYLYGKALLEGKGVTKNKTAGGEYITKAAKLNCPEAMFKLAYLLENGKGVSKNQVEAEMWYKKSAELGHHPALSRVARRRIIPIIE